MTTVTSLLPAAKLHARIDHSDDDVILSQMLEAALADVWAAHGQGQQTRGVFCYDERLRLLPAYLQQLEMESNGKGVTRDGGALAGPTAAVTWGGTGTDADRETLGR